MSHSPRIKSVSLVNAVLYNGSQTQLFALHGDQLLLEDGFVKLVPNPTKGKDTILIPFANVRCIALVNETVEQAKAEVKRVEAAKAKVEKFTPASHAGTVKFVKDPETGEIKETMV